MKNNLNLNLNQQLTITPQLQQAIKLLQMSTIELQQEIQMNLEKNPMLEYEGDNEYESVDAEENQSKNLNDVNYNNDNSPIETSWHDIYSDLPTSHGINYNSDYDIEYQETEELQDYLIWQANLTPFTPYERLIAGVIIDSINDDGYLSCSLDELSYSLDKEKPIEYNQIIKVLKTIHNFDPIGVGARSLQECLMVQLNSLKYTTPFLEKAKELVDNYFDLLGRKKFQQIISLMKINNDEFQKTMALIKGLNPKPGLKINNKKVDYIVPDVIAYKENNIWKVKLNLENLPKVRLNEYYCNYIQKPKDTKDSNFLKNQLTEAKWFLKSLQNRHDTLLKVATSLVEKQQKFFEYGHEAMKPMILYDIASQLDLHESTISRITNNKYIHTPRGIFELKFFFSSHVNTVTGGECSSTAIRALIKKIIDNENSQKPLSDQKITDLLKKNGIDIARRTITKYRENLMIPSSSQRKSIV